MMPSTSRPTMIRWGVLGALCLAALLAYIQRNAIALLEEDVRRDLGLGLTEMGWIMGGFFLAYALCQLPTAWLAQAWGNRKALGAYALLCTVMTAVTAWCGGFDSLMLVRIGLGIGQAGLFPCAAAIIAGWFPSSHRAIASGFLAAFMSIGAAVASFLTAELLVLHSWQPWLDRERMSSWQVIFVIYAIPSLLWAGWFWLWFRDRPEDHPGVNSAELELISRGSAPPPAGPGAIPWRVILSNPALWWLCLQQFFRAAGYIFFASWFATYLKESRDVTTRGAGWLTSLPLLAVVAGSLAGGSWSDWLLRRTGSRAIARQWLSAASLLGCAGCIILAYFIDYPLTAVLLISVGSFVAALAGPCAYSTSMDLGGQHLPTVFALMNMTGNIGAWAFPVAVPYLVQWTGNWDGVLFLFAGIYVAAACCWLLLDTRRTIG